MPCGWSTVLKVKKLRIKARPSFLLGQGKENQSIHHLFWNSQLPHFLLGFWESQQCVPSPLPEVSFPWQSGSVHTHTHRWCIQHKWGKESDQREQLSHQWWEKESTSQSRSNANAKSFSSAGNKHTIRLSHHKHLLPPHPGKSLSVQLNQIITWYHPPEGREIRNPYLKYVKSQ